MKCVHRNAAKTPEFAPNGIKLRKSRITHSVMWDFFMEKY